MSSMVWGVLLVLVGLELIIRAIFGISIPVLRIAFGLFLIYAGVIFIADLGKSDFKHSTRFGKKHIIDKQGKYDYETLFGESIIDLSTIEITEDTKIKTKTVFGSTTILINPNIPTTIKVDATFANAALPDTTQITFGSYTYTTDHSHQTPRLEINAKVSFGNLIIKKA